jgi:hypothetical protein
MWKMSFPPDVVVSIDSVIDLKPISAVVEAGDRFDEMGEGPA